MKKTIILSLLLVVTSVFSQSKKFKFDFEMIKNNSDLPHREALWLKDSISNSELNEVVDLVSALSRPAASQLVVSYFYLDGSFTQKTIKPYLDSLSIRPPDGDAGIIRVAYLAAKLRKQLIKLQNKNKYFVTRFSEKPFKVPEYKESNMNNKIQLNFDSKPAQVVIEILSKPNSTYEEILEKINLHQFDMLIKHHNQSFYPTPLTKERLITCLQIASSNEPNAQLYKYMNPLGLLYLTDVKNNLTLYKKQLKDLKDNEQSICNYINASIAPYLPTSTKFVRSISFFYINDADGWASNDVAAVDLNYYKDNYEKLLPILVHETYHSGQNAVALNDSIKRPTNVKAFVDAINYIFLEGTTSYISPPTIKTKLEYDSAVEKGITLLEAIYNCSILNYDAGKTEKLLNEGIAGGGPFYFMGAEMTRVIIDNLGSEKLASIIPYDGITFFKTYLRAVKKSKTHTNMFSKKFSDYILKIK